MDTRNFTARHNIITVLILDANYETGFAFDIELVKVRKVAGTFCTRLYEDVSNTTSKLEGSGTLDLFHNYIVTYLRALERDYRP